MFSLYEMIEKSLLLRYFSSSTPPPDPDTAAKSHSSTDSLLKASNKRWNEADLGYFDPHLDRAYSEGEIVSVGKDVYYRNVILFVQHCRRRQSTFICLLRVSSRAPSFYIISNQIHKSSWFHIRSRRKAGNMAWNDDCSIYSPVILQSRPKAIPLQASPIQSIRVFCSFPISATRATGSATFERVWAWPWYHAPLPGY